MKFEILRLKNSLSTLAQPKSIVIGTSPGMGFQGLPSSNIVQNLPKFHHPSSGRNMDEFTAINRFYGLPFGLVKGYDFSRFFSLISPSKGNLNAKNRLSTAFKNIFRL